MNHKNPHAVSLSPIEAREKIVFLKTLSPEGFVTELRKIKQSGDDWVALLRSVDIRVDGNTGTSATRKLGDFCRALFPKDGNRYFAEFFHD
jgi:hypothetical protein